MNVNAALRKVYNKIKYLQIPEEEIDSVNAAAATYYAGMEDSAKLFMNIYLGEISESQLEEELAKLEPMESVN